MVNEQRANNRAAWLPQYGASRAASRMQPKQGLQTCFAMQSSGNETTWQHSRIHCKRDSFKQMDRNGLGAIVAACSAVLVLTAGIVVIIKVVR